MSDAEIYDDDGLIKGDVDSEDSALEDPSVAIITPVGKMSFLQTQSLYNSQLADRIRRKLDEQEAVGEGNGSLHQESKLGSMNCVSVRSSLKPATMKTEGSTKAVERTQKIKVNDNAYIRNMCHLRIFSPSAAERRKLCFERKARGLDAVVRFQGS